MQNERIDSRNIKVHNRKRIYQYILSYGQASRQELVTALGLSLPTITHNLEYLTRAGWLRISENRKTTGGRQAAFYETATGIRKAIGVSLTAGYIEVVSVDLMHVLHSVKQERAVMDLDSDAYLRKIGEMVRGVMEEEKITAENLLGVGIGIPSLVNKDGSEPVYGMTANFEGKTWETISKYTGTEGRLFHDTYCAGYAESRCLKERGTSNAFYIMLGTSVGGAFVMNGQIYEGDHGKFGEIGHMTVDLSEEAGTCYCGKKGCLDTVARVSCLAGITDGRIEAFFEKLEKRDPEAERLWDVYTDHLAFAIHNVRMLFDTTIILGGDVGACLGPFMEDLYKKIDAHNPFGERAETFVLPCEIRAASVARGCADILVDGFLEELPL